MQGGDASGRVCIRAAATISETRGGPFQEQSSCGWCANQKSKCEKRGVKGLQLKWQIYAENTGFGIKYNTSAEKGGAF